MQSLSRTAERASFFRMPFHFPFLALCLAYMEKNRKPPSSIKDFPFPIPPQISKRKTKLGESNRQTFLMFDPYFPTSPPPPHAKHDDRRTGWWFYFWLGILCLPCLSCLSASFLPSLGMLCFLLHALLQQLVGRDTSTRGRVGGDLRDSSNCFSWLLLSTFFAFFSFREMLRLYPFCLSVLPPFSLPPHTACNMLGRDGRWSVVGDSEEQWGK